MYPRIRPITGDSTIKTETFIIPEVIKAEGPTFIKAGPIIPPIKEWDTLIGIPSMVQTNTHTIAPTSAARMKYSSITTGFTIPFPIVFATVTPKIKAAAKFQKAAHNTAANGESTLVETIVAIELAASFIPFRKSNRSASAIIKIINAVISKC
jgi:hypothetical protein